MTAAGRMLQVRGSFLRRSFISCMEPLHNLKAVTLRTGLSPHLLRMWERRYGAVQPSRSQSQRRLYTAEEVERLALLARLTRSGLSIGRIARLSADELRAMVEKLDQPMVLSSPSGVGTGELILRALAEVKTYNAAGLEMILDESMIAFGHSGMLERLLVPLLRHIGEGWQAGDISAAQEHAATATIKDYLARTLRPLHTPDSAPRLLVATPAGQMHELGAAIAAGLARKSGWNVTYLGPSLPAEEIAGAVLMNSIRAVALSIVYPADDPALPDQLIRLRSLMPDDVPLIVGGQAAPAYAAVLEQVAALRVEDLDTFTRVLGEVRSGKYQTPARKARSPRTIRDRTHG